MKTALFVDFDNIYLGLRRFDLEAAEVFATDPGFWLRWFERGLEGAIDGVPERRRLLVRKCYLNPRSFHMYRSHFTRAAFDVVDCPPLTNTAKNSSDIRMVMDIIDALEHTTRFDEFIILSGDADFTPVLLRLREHDRRTAVLAVGFAAIAYRAAADLVVDEEDFLEHGLQLRDSGPEPEVSRNERDEELAGVIMGVVRRLVATASGPIVLARAAHDVRRELGDRLGDDWAGYGTFGALLRELSDAELAIDKSVPGYVYDPRRATMPVASSEATAPVSIVERIQSSTEVPRLSSQQYERLFRVIEEALAEQPYNLVETSKVVRDWSVARGDNIARSVATYVLRGIAWDIGPSLRDRPHAAGELAQAFARNVMRVCQQAGIELRDEDLRAVDGWIVGALGEPSLGDERGRVGDGGHVHAEVDLRADGPIEDGEARVEAQVDAVDVDRGG